MLVYASVGPLAVTAITESVFPTRDVARPLVIAADLAAARCRYQALRLPAVNSNPER